MGGKGVAEGVTGHAFVETSFACCIFHRSLQDAFMKVMAALQTARLRPARAGRKDPLPSPCPRRGRDLALDGLGDPDGTKSVPQIVVMESTRTLELMTQKRHSHLRKHGVTITAAFRVANVDLSALEVDVFHTQHQALQQA